MSFRVAYLILIATIYLTVFGLPSIDSARDAHASFSAAGNVRPLESDQTVVFQFGLDGYVGVADTWISAHTWATPPQHTVNYGQNDNLTLSRNGRDNPLVRFDLDVIPSNSAVQSATLSLYNTTHSSGSPAEDFARRVEAFRVLRDWDEGNQTNSPIDAPGKRGATGDFAFEYHIGEGDNVPWDSRGMASPSDFASTGESFADVINEGWYEWDVTNLVRQWVRGEQPNFGLTLRDATGYEDAHRDWRTFVSSQSGDASLRPKLTLVYNPDTPLADAGPDQRIFNWHGGVVTLDGSGSSDHPGGDDESLTYSWEVVEAAYGSSMNGEIIVSDEPTVNFEPDAAGEWEIELTITNGQGESAKDSVHLQLLAISETHPRIYLTQEKLDALRQRAVQSNQRWTQLKARADGGSASPVANALVSQVTEQDSYCDEAISETLDEIDLDNNPSLSGSLSGDHALVYDWCYHRLTSDQRDDFLDYFNAWGDHQFTNPFSGDVPGWGNYWPRYAYSFGLIGLASYGDNPRAVEWLDEFRYRRYRDISLPLLDKIADGGAWPEGMIYDWIANWPRVKAMEAWRTATGEDLLLSSEWYRNRLGYVLLHRWPGIAEQFGNEYHPYPSVGDTERNRGTIANYERIMALILIQRFPDDPLSRQLQAYLAAPETGNSMSFLYHEEFLWFNPDQPTDSPDLLTHYAPATGTVFMRSGWPDGASDGDTSATHITFQSGDHFSYHQHYDQNSFTLFKRGDLALDSGVYSGDGRSDHDINYYARTIAHNSLLVYNPNEDFSSARPDAYANDGGQRTVYPATRAPQNVEYFDQHAVHYDTGEITRFEDDERYTYVLGDATNAYNNPAYNQTMDTSLDDNVAKLSRFQREFVYLRSDDSGDSDYVVVYDRVGVTDESFSGENTKLLFHTLNEPEVNGTPNAVSSGETLYGGADMATAESGDGKLFIKTLLPENRNIRKVGGRGEKAFWVFDGNYDWHWSSNESQPRPITEFDPVPYGEWRLELEPADTSLEHDFLTVLYPASIDTDTMPTTTLVTGAGVNGAHIANADLNRIALFSSSADGSPPDGVVSYDYEPTSHTLNVLFDLQPGASYNLISTLEDGLQTVTLTPDGEGSHTASDQGVLSFLLVSDVEPGICGDLNSDDSVNIFDVVVGLKSYLGQINLGTSQLARGDFDHSGMIEVDELGILLIHVTLGTEVTECGF